jgi:hypothetical protein
MASTYSELKFELIGTGDQAGNWGETTNDNIGTAIEQAITGLGNPVFTTDADLTIGLTDTVALQTARALFLNITSTVSLTATRTLIVPTIEKQYIVQNNTTGNQTINVQTAAGTVFVAVPFGTKVHIYVNGVDAVDAVTYFSFINLGTALSFANGGTGQTTRQAAIDALAGSVVAGQYLRGDGTDVVMSALQAADITGAVAIANGGTGQTTRQAAIDALAGSVTSGEYLRGNGTDVVMSAIQAGDVPTLNQNTTGTAANVTGTVAIINGGTGQTTRQAALDALAGSVTAGQYLRGDGVDVVMSAIQAGDVPTLNQNTTGTAGNVTGTVAIINGGTGETTRQAALDALAGSVTSGEYLRGNGTDVVMSSIQAGDVPTLNQNTTGTAANVTGTVAIANGGTGQTTAATAITALTGTQTAGRYLRSDGTNAALASIQAGDVPTLNQNTTGTAANVTGTVAIANGGTGQTTAAAAITALAGTQVSGQYLRSNGTATALSAIQAADVPTLNQNTTGTAANVTGTVAVANGGTGATTAANARTNLSAAASGANTDITSIALTSGTISAAPVNSTDIVNKEYADAIASGIHFHEAVDLATTAALPANTYNNGSSGVGATLTANANGALSVDSTLTVVGNRILVKNEANGSRNGVYDVTQVGSAGTPYILTRSTDMDTTGTGVDTIQEGDFFLVTSGTANANTAWVQQTPLPITIGTTAIVFQQFAAPITYTAGTGLSESPAFTFNIANVGTAGTYGSASSVPVLTTNAQGQVTAVTNTAISIPNSATTATALNTANAIVARDASGNFTAGTITATLSGNATNVTGTVAFANGGTGQTSRQAAMDALAGAVTAGQYLRGDGTDVVMSAIQAADVPTLNQNTTGTAANVTGTVAIINGGTGATTNSAARTNLGATTLGANLFTLTNVSAIAFPRFNADNTVSSLNAADFRTAIGAGAGTVTSVAGTGTVSGLTLTGTVTSTGNLTLGGTLAVLPSNFASQTANTVLAAPNGASGTPTFRALVAADVPTLNQNTTGTAAIATTATVTTSNTASAFKVPFANTTGSVTGNYGLLQDDQAVFTYNPSTNTLAVGTIDSTVDGTNAVGFRNIPQNSQSAAYTLVLGDAGRHIFHPVGDANARTFTIPANSSVAFPIGTVITFINMSVPAVTIAISTDTLTLSPAGTAGSRTLATNGVATCIKITATQWLISGTGLT